MLKFLGAMFFGLIAMATAAYFGLRPKQQRATDLDTARKLVGHGVDAAKKYADGLFNSPPAAVEGAEG